MLHYEFVFLVLLLIHISIVVLSQKVKKFSIPSEDHSQDGAAASVSKKP